MKWQNAYVVWHISEDTTSAPIFVYNLSNIIHGMISGRTGDIAAQVQLYMGAPIGVVEIHLQATPSPHPICSTTGNYGRRI